MGGTTEPTGVVVGEEGTSFLRHPEPSPLHLRGDALGRSYTPQAVAEGVVAWLDRHLGALWPGRDDGLMVEPCVGGGAFARALGARYGAARVVGLDVDPDAPGRADVGRFELADASRRWPVTGECSRHLLAVTNPPFGEAVGDLPIRIAQRCLASARVTALLMPWDYATQVEWSDLIDACSHVVAVTPRPFEHDRGMGLYVWGVPGGHGGQTFDRLRWRAS